MLINFFFLPWLAKNNKIQDKPLQFRKSTLHIQGGFKIDFKIMAKKEASKCNCKQTITLEIMTFYWGLVEITVWISLLENHKSSTMQYVHNL